MTFSVFFLLLFSCMKIVKLCTSSPVPCRPLLKYRGLFEVKNGRYVALSPGNAMQCNHQQGKNRYTLNFLLFYEQKATQTIRNQKHSGSITDSSRICFHSRELAVKFHSLYQSNDITPGHGRNLQIKTQFY